MAKAKSDPRKGTQDPWKANFAQNAKIRERVGEVLKTQINLTRQNRFELNEEWESFMNMWLVKHDGHHTYDGRAKLYIPEVRKNVEAQARQFVDAAFPSDDFFDCSPGDNGTKQGAKIWKSIQRWNIENSKLRTKYHTFCRQQILLGTSPGRVFWNEKTSKILRSARNKKTKQIELTRQMAKHLSGPDFMVRDLFRWYTLNPLSSELNDGCFEDYITGFYDLKKKSEQGLLWGFDQIIEGASEATQMDQLERYVRRVEEMGIQVRDQSYTGEVDMGEEDAIDPRFRRYLCTEVFVDLVLPEAFDPNWDEDPNMPISLRIEIYNNDHIGLIQRNGYAFQKAPYVVGRYILPNADEFYGQGQPKATQFMQHQLNSTAEQAMDSATLALNPLACIDPALAAQLGDNLVVEPGGTWLIRPDGVKFMSLPDVSSTGYAAMAQLRGQMEDYSDRAPAVAPQLAGKARSATQADYVDRVMQVDMRSFQVQNEIDVLQPLLEMWEALWDQNQTDDAIIMILGKRAADWKRMLVSKSATLGQYRYFWKVASQVMNKPIQARQMIDMLKVAGSFPPGAVNINFAEVFRVLWCEMFNLPDGDEIFGADGPDPSQDTQVEHKMLDMGMELEVLPNDDDPQHIADHTERMQQPMPEMDKKKLELHTLMHTVQQKKKIAMAMQMEKMRQMAMLQAQAQAAQDQGGQRKGIAQGSGNRTQLSPNASTGAMGSGTRA